MSKKTVVIIVVAGLLLAAMVAVGASRLLGPEPQTGAVQQDAGQEERQDGKQEEGSGELQLDQPRVNDWSQMIAGDGDDLSRTVAQVLQYSDWVDEEGQTVWVFDGSVLSSQKEGSEPVDHEFQIQRVRTNPLAPAPQATDAEEKGLAVEPAGVASALEALVTVDGEPYFMDIEPNAAADPEQTENVSRYTVSCDGIGTGELQEHRGVLVDVDFMDDATIAAAVGDRQEAIKAAVMQWCEDYAPLVSEVAWDGTSLTNWQMGVTAIYFHYGPASSQSPLTVLFSDHTDNVYVEQGTLTSLAESEHWPELAGESGVETADVPPDQLAAAEAEAEREAEQMAAASTAGAQEGGAQ